MDNKLFITWIIICFCTHLIRSIYEVLKHKKVLKPDNITFVIVFVNMLLLWGSWFAACLTDIHKIELHSIVHYAGISLVGIGILIFLISLSTIKTLESYEGDLITKGIYSLIRHPMYLGFIFWLIGLPVFFGSVWSMLISLVFIINVLFWRYLEEKELLQRFPQYREYRKKTWF